MRTLLMRLLVLSSVTVFIVAASSHVILAKSSHLTRIQKLGKAIFFDQQLSLNQNQACAGCHTPSAGWTGPHSRTNAGGAVYEGSIPGRFGNRKPPSAAYATLSPLFHFDGELFVGGNFWDGRATGHDLGNPAADQARGPFLNPAEQALPDSACVVYRVCTATNYAVPFMKVWGKRSCEIVWPADIEQTCATEGAQVALSPGDRRLSNLDYDRIAISVAAYEDSKEVNAFSSKFDAVRRGRTRFTPQEAHGLALFDGKALCSQCHPLDGPKAALTDFTFDNLGVPANPQNPVYANDPLFVDLGLGGFLQRSGYSASVFGPELGKHKVPTLRNVDLAPAPAFVKAFGHNGYFKSLEEIVHFYNTRDVLPTCASGDPGEKVTCWPLPEVPQNVNTDELGDLGLTPAEEAAIVAFLRTLNDGFIR